MHFSMEYKNKIFTSESQLLCSAVLKMVFWCPHFAKPLVTMLKDELIWIKHFETSLELLSVLGVERLQIFFNVDFYVMKVEVD